MLLLMVSRNFVFTISVRKYACDLGSVLVGKFGEELNSIKIFWLRKLDRNLWHLEMKFENLEFNELLGDFI